MGEPVRTPCNVTPGCEYYAGHGGGCGGTIGPATEMGNAVAAHFEAAREIWRLRAENERLTALVGAREAGKLWCAENDAELQRLREENARLKALCEQQHDDLMGPEEIKRACKVATGPWEAENQRLKMELADVKSICAEWNRCDDERTDELEWAKNEIYRRDPRLAAVRWGKR